MLAPNSLATEADVHSLYYVPGNEGKLSAADCHQSIIYVKRRRIRRLLLIPKRCIAGTFQMH